MTIYVRQQMSRIPFVIVTPVRSVVSKDRKDNEKCKIGSHLRKRAALIELVHKGIRSVAFAGQEKSVW